MSVVIEDPELESSQEPIGPNESGPDVSLLTDKVPEQLRAPRALAGIVLVLGLIFIKYCTQPIWHTDVWGHLSYGRAIWETGSLPRTEPLMPLEKGMPFVDGPWLSQLIGYLIVSNSRLQLAGLQGLFAMVVTACCALLAWRSYGQTRNGWFAALTIGLFLIINWTPFAVMRPQTAGLLCYVFLLTRLAGRRESPWDWIVIPGLFALWANLHPSFFTGLGILGCFCLGRAADLVVRTGSFEAAVNDRRVRRLFLLTELAAAAVLLNPYSIGLYVEAWNFSSNENLRDLGEWQPMTLREGLGQLLAAISVALVLLYRLSPRRVRCWELLSLVGLGLAALYTARMVIWWAPVAALMLSQHGYAVWRSLRRQPLVPEPPMRTGRWSFVAAGLIWISFMLSPLGVAIVHNKHSNPRRAMSEFTPRFVAEYFKKHPPQGQVFNIYEWGDYLQWAGPRDLKLFVNSHAHLAPREVWQAYIQVVEQRSGWEEILDRYSVNTIVIDRENRESLIKKLKDDDRWVSPPEESEGQVIFVRKKPIVDAPARKGDQS